MAKAQPFNLYAEIAAEIAACLAVCFLVLAIGQAQSMSLSENPVVGPRASVFPPDKAGEAGDIDCIVDGALDVHRDGQAGQLRLALSDSSCASSV